MKKCIYCHNEKDDSEFSEEHIMPSSLIGDMQIPELKTNDVCVRCNNEICGLFVDGPFINSWFVRSELALNAYSYVDLVNGSAVPLCYGGRLEGLPLAEDMCCELWLGPVGCQVLHFHTNDTERYKTYAGGDPIKKSKSPGKAIFINVSINEFWLKTALKSFHVHFKKSERVLANLSFSDPANDVIGRQPTDDEKVIIDAYNQMVENKNVKLRQSTQIGFEQRFLAKLAMGMGYKLFGSEYLNTSYVQVLKKYLFEQDTNKRNLLPIYASSYFEEKIEASKYLEWPGAITMTFMPIRNFILLSVCVCNKPLYIAVADSTELWTNHPKFKTSSGFVYLILPQRNFFSGRIELENYLAHRIGAQKIPILSDVEKWKI